MSWSFTRVDSGSYGSPDKFIFHYSFITDKDYCDIIFPVSGMSFKFKDNFMSTNSNFGVSLNLTNENMFGENKYILNIYGTVVKYQANGVLTGEFRLTDSLFRRSIPESSYNSLRTYINNLSTTQNNNNLTEFNYQYTSE